MQTGIKTSTLTIREIRIIFFTNAAPLWMDDKVPSRQATKEKAQQVGY
jgi:hypothetical protein